MFLIIVMSDNTKIFRFFMKDGCNNNNTRLL